MVRMKPRAYIIAIATLAVVLTAHTLATSGVAGKVVTSARNFQKYYADLEQGAGTLSPFERVVFSLVLSNSKTRPATAAPTSGRT
jgi:hypothetical protein